MFERFSPGARRAIVVSQEFARRCRQPTISAVHIVVAAMGGEDEGAEALLAAVGADRATAVERLAALATMGDTDLEAHIPFTADAKELVRSSMPAALDTGSSTIEVLHLVLAAVRTGSPVLVGVLGELGITEEAVLAALGSESGPGFKVRSTKGGGGFLRRGKRAADT